MSYNLSMICKNTNRFHAQGYSRSASFVLAWRLSKQTAEAKVSGTSYGDRQELLSELVKADPESVTVELEREPGNSYDSNAVVVIVRIDGTAHRLGYVPAKAARLIAPIIDAGHTISAALRVVGGWLDGISYGARLRLAV